MRWTASNALRPASLRSDVILGRILDGVCKVSAVSREASCDASRRSTAEF